MKCIICSSTAQAWDIAQDGVGVDCVECGRYDISGVSAARATGEHRYCVEMMRHWLAGQREAHPDVVPVVPHIRPGNEQIALCLQPVIQADEESASQSSERR